VRYFQTRNGASGSLGRLPHGAATVGCKLAQTR